MMAELAIKVARPLSSRLLRVTLAGALVLGLLVSLVQTWVDYSRDRIRPDEDAASLIKIVIAPASAIVFSLDGARAEELLSGLLSQPSVAAAELSLEDGRLFAGRQRQLQSGYGRAVSDALFGQVRRYDVPLQAPIRSLPGDIGTLSIEIDTFHYGKAFFARVFVTMAGTLFYALIVTMLSLGIFYVLVTRPLSSVILSIQDVGGRPERARLSEPPGHGGSEIGLLVQLTNQHFMVISDMLLKLREAEAELKDYSDNLERIVAERTQALSASLKELESAKDHLIQSEKMAALGGLVAGVAHEVNTPLGIAVTATSSLAEALSELRTRFEARTLTTEDFSELVGHALDGTQLLVSNINRAARLISDFKKTAVDQISEARCEFQVHSTLSALIASLHPETRKVPVKPLLECPPVLRMRSLPGVLTQVVANLILNSVRHAFDGVAEPEIVIKVSADGDWAAFDYRDNGVGVPAELHQRIFEPFYTSKRGQGGSGLGLNIVYNLITRKLGGRLVFESSPGCGVHFRFDLPVRLSMDPAGITKSGVISS